MINISETNMFVLVDKIGKTLSPPFFAFHSDQAVRKANLTISSQGLNKEEFSLWFIGVISIGVDGVPLLNCVEIKEDGSIVPLVKEIEL